MDLILVLLVIGVGLMLAGFIPQIGTSKAERMGKVEVSEAKRRRIKAGNIITAHRLCRLHTGLSSVKAPVIRRSPLT